MFLRCRRLAWLRLLAALLVLALASASCVQRNSSQAGPNEPPSQAFRGVVEHVDDGDTLTVRSDNRSIRIRLQGIDAPEGTQRFGPESRNHLRVLVFGRVVDVRPTGVDQYGRVLARVTVDGRDVCEEMVGSGWAWHYRAYSSDKRLAELEAQARGARRGLWADPAPKAPWEERSEERARGETRGSNAPRAPVSRPHGPFHGNVKSHVYHAPTCPDYDCANCTAIFSTREAAEAAGYRPDTTCVR